MRSVFLVLGLSACAAPAGAGGDTDPAGDAAFVGDARLAAPALAAHLDALADIAADHGGNRALGTSGYDASVDYVADALSALGLDPSRDAFVVPQWTGVRAAVTGPGLTLRDGPGLLDGSPGGRVQGAVVAVDLRLDPSAPANSSTSGCDDADFEGFPRGAVALVERGTCPFIDKAQRAQAAGAVAVLVFNEGQAGREDVVQGGLGSGASDLTAPVLALSYADGAALAAYDGTVEVVAEVLRDDIPSASVIVDLPGTQPGVWVVGAHLDSVPAGPGINDNGSGVAVLLQLAEVLASQPPRAAGVRLAFWGAEEVGLVGSLDYVDRLQDGSDLVFGNLNLDMVASPNAARMVYDGDGSTYDIPDALPVLPGSADIEARFRAHFDARGLATRATAYDGRSDYLGFALAGLPTGGLFTGAEAVHPQDWAADQPGKGGLPFDACYHRACDDRDNVDVDVMQEMAEATADVLASLASDPVPRPATPVLGNVPVAQVGAGCGHAHAVVIR